VTTHTVTFGWKKPDDATGVEATIGPHVYKETRLRVKGYVQRNLVRCGNYQILIRPVFGDGRSVKYTQLKFQTMDDKSMFFSTLIFLVDVSHSDTSTIFFCVFR